MPNHYDYKKFAILYVDDEEKSLINFTRAFGDEFQIRTASRAADALQIIQKQPESIGVLMTDQRMPGEKGVWLLEQSRRLRPQIMRILVTAYADMDAAIAAVNSGAIYKYVAKPWDPAQLEMTLRQSLEFFMVQDERDRLLHEKMSVLRNMMIADRIVSLGLLAAGLSHHIRNSMVAVKTFLELAPLKLAEEKGNGSPLRDPDFWREYHQNVQGQIERINSLLGDLRVASDGQSNQPFENVVHLHAVVAHALDQLQQPLATRHIRVESRIPVTLPPLRVDKPKFDRLFDLLLRDELAMLPSGSRVTLAAEERAGELILELRDDGPPLPEQALRVVLDPFTAPVGVPSEYGINLMACFFIVHHHGGKIEAENLPGGGNRFAIHLPLHPELANPSFEEIDFFKQAMLNESLWQKLLSAP